MAMVTESCAALRKFVRELTGRLPLRLSVCGHRKLWQDGSRNGDGTVRRALTTNHIITQPIISIHNIVVCTRVSLSLQPPRVSLIGNHCKYRPPNF